MFLKKIWILIFTVLALFSLSSCELPSADDINDSVEFPESYSIMYQVKNKEGVIKTVIKTVDSEENVYFKSGKEELLFIKSSESYTEYKKDSDGAFVATEDISVDESYIEKATEEIKEYAEQSKKQYIPGMKSRGEQELLGRNCKVFGIKLGGDSHNVSYSYYVDEETGICFGFESDMLLADNSVPTDDTMFTCTEFITKDIPSLKGMISE